MDPACPRFFLFPTDQGFGLRIKLWPPQCPEILGPLYTDLQVALLSLYYGWTDRGVGCWGR